MAGNSDAVSLLQLNGGISTVATTVSRLYLKKDGTTLLTGNINLNNHKVVNWQYLLIKMIVQINHMSIKK